MTMISQTSSRPSLGLLAFIFEISVEKIDDFYYASSAVVSPLVACVGETAEAAVSYWFELYEAGELPGA
jgi:hypothetical protein